MCIDYTDLNKHCPKDPFPLPRIYQVVDSTAGSVLLSFLTATQGITNNPESRRSRQNSVHNAQQHLLLQGHDLWPKNASATYQKAI
jgi:hypothetical protein